ncbi:hypothetical protein [Pseudomonas marginalis]|uniref:hypothetical protein n=1 Tax=Pseudomonas marginalis TaxID=298 RepID=UPI0011B467B5|nr:hypothetical protein [Pseudomonas marginalis]KAA8555123.1 hypothetical protein FX984_01741 [Pseudomonas marginalis]TWR71880.1 hypothetical protein FIV40_09245 [Pseudomonas marginalis]
MSLNMEGQIDLVFVSVEASRTVDVGGQWVDGIWTPGVPQTSPYVVNIQPASDREVDFIRQGGERITDVRRIYINQGEMQLIDQTGTWAFLGQQWKAVKCDNRCWRNYCKVLVMRIDNQSGGPA